MLITSLLNNCETKLETWFHLSNIHLKETMRINAF